MRSGATASLVFLFGLISFPVASSAHHSYSSTYDVASITELEGEVTRVLWQNPHVRFTIRVRNDRGLEALWEIEANSVSILRRMGISPDILKVGDRVRVAGNPARRGASGVFAHNVFLPGGQEVILWPGAAARWSKRTVGTSETWLATAGKGSDPKRGIFRVWSTSLATPFLFPDDIDPKSHPLTPGARAAAVRFDAVRDNPLQNCAPKGMPTIMEQPYPMEFVEQRGDILLRLEEYDTLRTIHMKASAGTNPAALTLLGYSVGRWDRNTLVVTTTRTSWRHFNTVGIPLGAAAEMVERFTPSADGSRLDYQLTVTDPETFTKPVVLTKHWIWLPDIKISPYQCTNER